MFLNKREYGLIGFEKSNRKNKKYNAILINYNTKQKKIIPFGDLRYQQYKDRTYLNLYSHFLYVYLLYFLLYLTLT